MFKNFLLIAMVITFLNGGIVYAATTDAPNNKQHAQKTTKDTTKDKPKPITDADTEDYDNPAYY